MISNRNIAICIPAAILSVSVLCGGDLSRYREFQFGEDVPSVVKRVGMKSSEVKIVHQRPVVIQELKWQPWQSVGSTREREAVREITFSFYGGGLFRMSVIYDRDRTEGLTAADLIDAMSMSYGTATKPEAEMLFPSVYNETVRVLARWDDDQYCFNLLRSSYGAGFAMVMFSKRLDALAQTTIAEASRLDEQEAPQREIDRQRKQQEETRVQQEAARKTNKTSFRP